MVSEKLHETGLHCPVSFFCVSINHTHPPLKKSSCQKRHCLSLHCKNETSSRSRAEVARETHNLEVGGSTPSSATNQLFNPTQTHNNDHFTSRTRYHEVLDGSPSTLQCPAQHSAGQCSRTCGAVSRLNQQA